MAEADEFDRYARPRDRNDYYDPREGDESRHSYHNNDNRGRDRDGDRGGGGAPGRGRGGGRGYMQDDRRGGRGYMREDRRGGRGGRGHYMNDRRSSRGGGGRGGPPHQRRADDRFRLFRTAASQIDWKGDPVEYSEEFSTNDSNNNYNNNKQRPSEGEDNDIRQCLRLLWSSTPEPPAVVEKQVNKQKRSQKEDSDDSSSESASSSSEESRRRRRRKRGTPRKKAPSKSRRRRKDDDRGKRSKRRRHSSSSSSHSSSSRSDGEDGGSRSNNNESDSDESRSPKRLKRVDDSSEPRPETQDTNQPSAEIPVAAAAATVGDHQPDEDSDDSSVGPRPAPVDADGNTVSLTAGGGDKAHYGKALLPGEGTAMAQFVQNNMRVPRRGEIGYGADEIERFENSGYVMSGSRHARMNAVRIRKENQVYTAEEQRALAMITLEEKAEKEKALVQDFRSMLEQKLENKDAGGD